MSQARRHYTGAEKMAILRDTRAELDPDFQLPADGHRKWRSAQHSTSRCDHGGQTELVSSCAGINPDFTQTRGGAERFRMGAKRPAPFLTRTSEFIAMKKSTFIALRHRSAFARRFTSSTLPCSAIRRRWPARGCGARQDTAHKLLIAVKLFACAAFWFKAGA